MQGCVDGVEDSVDFLHAERERGEWTFEIGHINVPAKAER